MEKIIIKIVFLKKLNWNIKSEIETGKDRTLKRTFGRKKNQSNEGNQDKFKLHTQPIFFLLQVFPGNINIDWHAWPFSKLKKPQVRNVGLKDHLKLFLKRFNFPTLMRYKVT